MMKNPIILKIDLIDERIDRVRATYVDGSTNEAVNASDGIEEMFDQLLQRPDFGQPLYGKLVNTVTRGMRLGCFYLRSAATGVGKTRSLVADMCNCACDEIFDGKEWVDNGPSLPALFISTELELEELQTQMMAFISGVDEYYILNRTLEFEELERVKKAIEIIKRMPLYVEVIPDFNLKDIEKDYYQFVKSHSEKYEIDKQIIIDETIETKNGYNETLKNYINNRKAIINHLPSAIKANEKELIDTYKTKNKELDEKLVLNKKELNAKNRAGKRNLNIIELNYNTAVVKLDAKDRVQKAKEKKAFANALAKAN